MFKAPQGHLSDREPVNRPGFHFLRERGATADAALVQFLTEASYYHSVMARHLSIRLDDELAADTEALARAEGQSLNETVKTALREAVERRRKDPRFKARVRRIIEEDRALLERLAK